MQVHGGAAGQVQADDDEGQPIIIEFIIEHN